MQGIDVAKWNEITDYNAVRRSGVEFAIVKVINASNSPDGLLDTHIRGFKAAGISCSMGYTYSYANSATKAAKAAQAFVDTAKPAGINYMWLDLEDACMKGLGHILVDVINIYRTMAHNNGLKFGIYTYSSFYNTYIKGYMGELADIPFWIARYPSTKDMTLDSPIPDASCLPSGLPISGWQYSSKGIVDGVKGYTDLNTWYDGNALTNTATVTPEYNPFAEPVSNCRVGTLGNDANWVLWYLWRFGKLLDSYGNPDATQIDGLYSNMTSEIVKDVQSELALVPDGIVGKITRAAFKKLA